jgi:peptide/nickel transport system substrate-binding protein
MDRATRVAALRSGRVDYIENEDWQQSMVLAGTNPELQMSQMPYMGFDIALRVDHDPYTDIRIRKAMNMSIDRDTIAQTHFGGTAEGIPCGWVNPLFEDYCYSYDDWSQDVKDGYSYDPEGAKALLAEAGFPDGFNCELILMDTTDTALYEIFKYYLEQIGINMEINVMPSASYTAYSRAFQHQDMCGNQATGSIIAPWLALGMNKSTDGSNYNQLLDPEYDAMIDGIYAAPSAEGLKEACVAADKYIIENYVSMRLFSMYNFNIWQPRLKGYGGENMLRAGRWAFARMWVTD